MNWGLHFRTYISTRRQGAPCQARGWKRTKLALTGSIWFLNTVFLSKFPWNICKKKTVSVHCSRRFNITHPMATISGREMTQLTILGSVPELPSAPRISSHRFSFYPGPSWSQHPLHPTATWHRHTSASPTCAARANLAFPRSRRV